ncbi:hypothetical protein [Salana multivorans]
MERLTADVTGTRGPDGLDRPAAHLGRRAAQVLQGLLTRRAVRDAAENLDLTVRLGQERRVDPVPQAPVVVLGQDAGGVHGGVARRHRHSPARIEENSASCTRR